MMDMPKPGEEHRKLQAFVGEWKGDEKMFPSPWDPKGGPAKSRTVTKADLDGFFIVSDYTQERDGKVSYRGHGVYGWDSFQKHYTMHWFDTMGCDPGEPAKGVWEGNTVRFQSQHPMGHGRYTYVFDGKDRMTFKLEHSQDGKNWSMFMEGTSTK